MRVKEVMTSDPVCCTPETSLRDVARMMVQHDCGEIPIVESMSGRKLAGVITDRDIACRAVAEGKDPASTQASECMSSPVVTANEDDSLDDCCNLMERHQVRRIPVVDASGRCCGIVAQADVAKKSSKRLVGEVVREVSRPTDTPMKIETRSELR
ncbi:MAG TPA: CBS domain-containing protein [Thermoanaerobaculia bacterium]